MSASNGLIVDAQQVSRVFSMPAGPVTAVRDVTLQIRGGDHVAVRGPSGCGKSTLLHMLGCVETQTSGTLLFDGQDVSRLSDARRSLLHAKLDKPLAEFRAIAENVGKIEPQSPQRPTEKDEAR